MKRFTMMILILTLFALAPYSASHASLEPAWASLRDPGDWSEQLETLRPSDPIAYLELAEDIADQAADESDLDLARRLFSLAGLLDTPRLGRSACLALAEMEPQEHLRNRLLAMASLLGGESGQSGFSGLAEAKTYSPSTVLSVAEAFSLYRRGLGSRALSKLRAPGAMELLVSVDHLIRGGSQRFLEDCKSYNGQNKPPVSEFQLTNMLRLELALLAGETRSWSSELLLSDGSPLIEIDPNRLEETFGIDPNLNIFRNGRWVRKSADSAD